jgi:predicted dithiol-disulfide oxidoreductase (DUF899 family)
VTESVPYRIGTRAEWIAARPDLVEREKGLTRVGGELARPWIRRHDGYP